MSFSPLWHFTEFELLATEHLIERLLMVHIIGVVGPPCSVDTQLRLQTHYHSISLTALAGISLHKHTGASVGCTVIINCLVTSWLHLLRASTVGPALCLPPHSMGSLFWPGPLEELSVGLQECSGPSVAPKGRRRKDGWMDGCMDSCRKKLGMREIW